MLRLLVDFGFANCSPESDSVIFGYHAKSGLSLLGVHLKCNARPATPSRVGWSDKMSDPFSNGTAIAGKRTNLQGSGVEP